MRVIIEGNVGKGKQKHKEFIERDFKTKKEIEEHIKKYCESWKNVKVKEV